MNTPSPEHRLQVADLFYFPTNFQYDFRGQLSDWSGKILGITLEGRGCLEWPGHRLPISRGQTYLIHLHEQEYVLRNLGTETWALAWMYYHPDPAAPPLAEQQSVRQILFVEQLLHRLVQAYKNTGRTAAQPWFRALIEELRQPEIAPADSSESQQRHSHQMNALIRQIRARPQDDWTIARMAHQVGISPTHFTRVFRAHTGQSPGHFLIQTRLEIARSFLEMTSMSIARIAQELGYHDAFAFSHQFKKYLGKSPSQWRAMVSSGN